MTKEELESGAKFSYEGGSYYSLQTILDNSNIICQLGVYVANIKEIDDEFITAYTYVMNKRVDLKIDISKCILMEESAGAVILK
jgi:hypothetical protein